MEPPRSESIADGADCFLKPASGADRRKPSRPFGCTSAGNTVEVHVKLSKTSAQAALAMAYLASRAGDGLIRARHIAEHLGIPTDSALKILQSLARQEMILSQLGRGGGYRLHRNPEQISLLNIVEAIDGPISGEMRLDSRDGHASPSVLMLRSVCMEAAKGLREELSRISVADLVHSGQGAVMAEAV